MTMDISRLGIEVKSDGIDKATTDLTALGKAADSTEKKVTKLTATIDKLLQSNMSATMQAWTGAMGGVNTAMASLATSVQSTVSAINTQITALNNLTPAITRATSAQNSHTASSGVFVNTLKAMTAAALGYTGINFAMSIIHAADEWTMLNTKMIAATGSQNNATVSMEHAYDIAQKLSQPLEGTIKLYSRLAPAMAQAGKDSETTRQVVQGLATALRLGGAQTSEANAAMLNFAHAMSAGSINAREFNSLAREAPLLMRGLADQMTNGNVHSLKLLASQGKISIDEIIKTIQKMQPEWDKQLAAMPLTMENEIQRIKNTWLKSIGEMGQQTAFNTDIANGLKVFENMIPTIVREMGDAFMAFSRWVKENQTALENTGRELKGFAGDILDAGRALATWNLDKKNGELTMGQATLIGMRYLFAAIQDILVLIVGLLGLVNGAMVKLVGEPIKGLLDALQYISEAVDGLASKAAKVADAMGAHGVADAMRSVSKEAQITTQWFEKMKMNVDNVGNSLVETGGARLKQLRDQSAIMSVYNRDEIAADKAELDALREASDMADRRHRAYDENYNKNPDKPTDPKALAAAERLTKEFERQQESLQVQIDQGIALNKELDKYGQEYEKIGPMQKELIKYEDDLAMKQAKHAGALAISRAEHLVDLANIAAMEERIADITKKNLAADKNVLSGMDAELKTASDNLRNLEDKVASIGGMKGDKKDSQVSHVQNQLDMAESGFTGLSPDATAADIQKVIDKDKELLSIAKQAAAQQKILDQASIGSQWEKLFDPKKAQAFGDSLTKAFGNTGKALKVLVDGLRSYAVEQEKLAAGKKLLEETTDPTAHAQRELELAQATSAAQIKMYGDMTEAAQGFFKKGTAGYEIMGAAEKAFRVAELAMSISNFVEKSGMLAAFTGMFVASSTTQVASAVTAGIGVAAAETPKQAAYGISALAAALTIPPPASYVAFAATAALLLAIGVAISGAHGGSRPSSAQRQATQGTGTVLGDASKQSQSVENSINLLANNSNVALQYSSGMLSSLRSIQSALTGTTNSIALSGGGITGTNFSSSSANFKSEFMAASTSAFAGIKDSLTLNITGLFKTIMPSLGFGSSKTLTDSGILAASQTIGSIIAGGFKASQYQDVTSKHSLFGIGLSSSSSESTKALDPSITSNFTQIVKGMAATVTQAAQALGMSGATVAKTLNGITLSLGNISLKGLTSDQITQQLSAVFSAFGDKITTAVLGPTISKFQQAGEGLLQTAVRVASGVENASFELGKLGLTAIKFTDIINTSGDIATEIVRQTIMMKEGADGISNIISTMSSAASDLVTTYQSLLTIRLSLKQLGIAKDVSADLINAAGGLQTLQDALSSYTKDFFSSSQQQAMATQALQQQFAALGLQMPNTKAQFVDLVNQLSASGTSGQDLAVKVIDLASAFNDLSSSATDNISSLTDDLTTAYNNQSDSLTTLKKNMLDFSSSLSAFKTTLITGDLSTGNAVDKYEALKAQYADTQAKAMAGDQTAIGQFQTVAQDFLKASQAVNASGAGYTSDFQSVLTATQKLQDFTSAQANVADEQLAALQSSVSQLITINTSVQTVSDAIKALQAAITTGVGATTSPTTTGKETIMPVINGTHANGLTNVPWDGYIAQLHKGEAVLTANENKAYQADSGNAALLAEVRALRTEVQGLRNDSAQHAGMLATAVVTSAKNNAEAVVDGNKTSHKQAAYAARAKVAIV